jgi:hypothetical protein
MIAMEEKQTISYTCSASVTLPPSKKCVVFNELVIAFKTKSFKDYKSKEFKATWHDVNEKQQIRENLQITLSLMDEGKSEADDDIHHCIRGLEPLTEEGGHGRRRRRRDALKAVLLEQERTGDEQCIAEVYRKHCIVSTTIARLMGLVDAQAVDDNIREFVAAAYGKSVSSSKDPPSRGSILGIPERQDLTRTTDFFGSRTECSRAA